jgi:formylglycine-generating enzyme required for sulfatase activity
MIKTTVMLLAVIVPVLHSTSAQARWDERFFNPKPAEGDLILPMPCDGAMVFRPVGVLDRGGPLDDKPVELGAADTDLGFNEFERKTYLAAPFTASDGKRLYWMGKYEVTRDQYAAVTGQCPTPSPAGRLAQSEVSWSDAVLFTERWTAWLLQNARDSLPRHGQDYGYIRLPTEDEWEYAARGGAKVTESEYLARTFPMPDGVDRYAVAGARASEGRPQQVGQLLPNPLGLHDILGNVSEWVLDSYRLNHVGRPHGMAGGEIARGGSYITPLSELRTSMRDEIPPFDPSRNAPSRLRFVGFRVVLASPAGGGLQAVEALRKAFEEVKADAQRNSTSTADASQKLLQQMQQEVQQQTTDNTRLRTELDRLAARLAAEASARAEAAREALGAQVSGAAALAYTVCRLGRTITVQQEALQNIEKLDPKLNPNPPGSPGYRMLQDGLAVNRADRASSLDAYSAVVRRAAADLSRQDLDSVLQQVKREYQERSDRRLALLPVVSTHLVGFAEQHPMSPDKMLQGIGDVALCPPPTPGR